MNSTNEKNHGGGFLLGILVGVAVTLLVTTKKGRKLMHSLAEEGMGRFGDWEKILKDVADAIDDDDYVDGDDYIVKEEMQQPRSAPRHPEPAAYPTHETPSAWRAEAPDVQASQSAYVRQEVPPIVSDEPVHHRPASVSRPRVTSRRFFRGIPRR